MKYDCPRCGEDEGVQVAAVLDEYGRRLPVIECRGCGRHDVDWSRPMDDPSTVVVVKRQCPHCGGSDAPVYCVRMGVSGSTVRYHRCRGCSLTFRSVEIGGAVVPPR